MAKYKVDTDHGSYMVETEDPPAQSAATVTPGPSGHAPTWKDDVADSAKFLGNEALGVLGAPVAAAKSIYDMGSRALSGQNPVQPVIDSSVSNFKKAQADTDPYAKAAHYLGAIPLSPIGGMYDKFQEGDMSGLAHDIGDTAGQVVLGKAGPEIPSAATKIIRAPLKGAANTAAEITGHTSGVGGPVMREALNTANPGQLTNAMRGGMTDQEVLGHFQDALQNVKDARSAEYQKALQNQPAVPDLDITPIHRAASDALRRFNIRGVPNKTGGMDLDFSRSTIRDAAAQNEVRGIVNDLQGWGNQHGDLQPAGVDILKRRIDDTYSPSSSARAIVQSVKNSARDTLNTQVPGYQKMTSGYAQASQFIDNLRDLSLDGKNPGTAIRKLSTALKQNNQYRQTMVEALNQYSGTDLKAELAGMRLHNLAPRGIEGPLTGAGLLATIATGIVSPKAALALAMSSPRIMGELMVAMNKAKPALRRITQVPQLSPTAAKVAAVAASPTMEAQPGPTVADGTIVRHKTNPSVRMVFKDGQWQPLQ